MAAEPIRFFHRYHKAVETEKVFGESWLRFAYENPAGRFFVWLLARRKIFSWWYGRKMNKKVSALRVLPFITAYDIDVDEFAKSAFDFKTFNEFFYRALKPEARPIAPGDRVAVFPADGRHLVFPNVENTAGFYAKGQHFTLHELFNGCQDSGTSGAGFTPADSGERTFGEHKARSTADEGAKLAEKFSGGAMLISRLCPVDYHRFHFPVSGAPSEPRLINGYLYSVSPVALRRNLHYLVQNKRVLTLIESPVFGPVAMFEIGATNVGSIRQSYVPGREVTKGEEKGLFAFGGSCVVTVFQRGKIKFDTDLIGPSAEHMEVYARMGDRLGVAP
jgi:phosphatidylserine decarboxylase